MNNLFSITVSHGYNKIRCDIFCSTKIQNMTRAKLKHGLKHLTINGKPAKLSHKVNTGDTIEIVWQNPIPQLLIPENIPLRIIFESNDMIVVNKPAGMVTHPAPGNWTGTLVQALSYYRLYCSPFYDEYAKNQTQAANRYGSENQFRQGIVHRLDKDTSGILITVRNTRTEATLKKLFKTHKIAKYYLAILTGIPKKNKDTIITSVFRHPSKKICFSASDDLSKGKYAASRYKVLKTYGNYTLVWFRIFTGRTHQIRLHAKFIGCPVVGDPLYGVKRNTQRQYGLLLHAYKLKIPFSLEDMALPCFTAPIPRRFKHVINMLKHNPHQEL